MDASQVIEKLEAGLSARRVFSEPIERDGSVVVLAAKVRGGGGAGVRGEQSGRGFGLIAHPSGAFIIGNGSVRWRPAIDLNRAILGGQLLLAIGLLSRALVARNRPARRFGRAQRDARRLRR